MTPLQSWLLILGLVILVSVPWWPILAQGHDDRRRHAGRHEHGCGWRGHEKCSAATHDVAPVMLPCTCKKPPHKK